MRVLDGDLKEQIRDELAQTKAREEGRKLLNETLDKIPPQIRAYQKERNRWRSHVRAAGETTRDDAGGSDSHHKCFGGRGRQV